MTYFYKSIIYHVRCWNKEMYIIEIHVKYKNILYYISILYTQCSWNMHIVKGIFTQYGRYTASQHINTRKNDTIKYAKCKLIYFEQYWWCNNARNEWKTPFMTKTSPREVLNFTCDSNNVYRPCMSCSIPPTPQGGFCKGRFLRKSIKRLQNEQF